MSSPNATLTPSPLQPSAGTDSGCSTESQHRPATPSSSSVHSDDTRDHDIIPPYHSSAPRTLVLCFDGTGDKFDSDNSNVVKFFSLLKRDDRREQMVYYQTGIGTYTSPQLVTALGQTLSKTLDEMVAWNLGAHVMGGYEFLMQNYEAGDKICLFGFSRGAYTARALAGMLHKVGLLPSHNLQQIPFAYRMYTRTDAQGWKQSTAFKKAFCIDVDIDFIGVWDTVCSVGLIPQRLPFTASNTAIRVFRHALSLDERRARFKANQYNRPSEWEQQQGTHGDMPKPVKRRTMRRGSVAKPDQQKTRGRSRSGSASSRLMEMARDLARLPVHGKEATGMSGTTAVGGTMESRRVAARKRAGEVVEELVERSEAEIELIAEETEVDGSKLWETAKSRFGTFRTMWRKKNGKRLTEEEEAFNRMDCMRRQTDIKEVWFAGCHSDVGGGSVPDSEHHSLARIPLRWMIRECFRTNTGIRFHSQLLREVGLEPHHLWPHVQSPYEPEAPDQPPTPISPLNKIEVESTVMHADATFTEGASSPSKAHAHVSISKTQTQTVIEMTQKESELKPCRPTSKVDEMAEEREDARSPLFDQLSLQPFWWFLEIMPTKQRKQLKDNQWRKYTSVNLGQGRTVPPYTERFYMHKSVKMRMEAQDLPGGPYKPKARWGKGTEPIYVD